MGAVDRLLEEKPVFLGAAGFETTLEFKTDFPMREFASFEALLSPAGNEHVESIDGEYVKVATQYGMNMVVDTHTWRASKAWFEKLGIDPERSGKVSKIAAASAMKIAQNITRDSNGLVVPIVQGLVGPKIDAYSHDDELSFDDARSYHREQVRSLKEAGLEVITAATMNNITEASAVAAECSDAGVSCIVSFTLETDGCLIRGETLKEAILAVDAVVGTPPLFYMVNCTHPKHIKLAIAEASEKKEEWIKRLRGIRANGSDKSHDELNNSKVLDEGIPSEWAKQVVELRNFLPSLKVLAGCCGTNAQHIEEIAKLVHKSEAVNN